MSTHVKQLLPAAAGVPSTPRRTGGVFAHQPHTLGDLNVGLGWFGDGSDGDATIAVDTTLTRDMFYNNLTVQNGASLHSSQYRIHVRGTLTIEAIGGVRCDGASSTSNIGGATPVGVLGTTTLVGGNGGTNANGTPATTVSARGVGGAGGTGGGDVGRTGASSSAYAAVRGFPFIMNGRSNDANLMAIGGRGGGGGGATGVGGGGGAGGGVLIICAHTVVNNGEITARGGNGAPGQTTSGGGGGGGGGGCVILCRRDYSGAGVISVAGGTGGAGLGTGTAGTDGSVGTVREQVLS